MQGNNIVAVIGAFWGDEGKGKIIQALGTKNADYAVRWNGGSNAGHTIYFQDKKYVMRQFPAIIKKNIKYYFAQGTLLDPFVFFDEYFKLNELLGKDFKVFISEMCFLILSYHKEADGILEKHKGDFSIGTTRSGIGPCMMDRVNRIGIRVADLFDEVALKNKLEVALNSWKPYFAREEINLLSIDKLLEEYGEVFQFLKKYALNITFDLKEIFASKKNIFIETAQGSLLDIDHGTYPYVTSSATNLVGFENNLGFTLDKKMMEKIACTKLYITRVGEGILPTQIKGDLHDRLQEKGQEVGSVVPVKRRVGWFDLVAFKKSHLLNNYTSIAMVKVDILSDLKEIKVCTHYELDDQVCDIFPSTIEMLKKVVPVYQSFPSYHLEHKLYKTKKDLPQELLNILDFIEKVTKLPIKIISYGPKYEETIFC